MTDAFDRIDEMLAESLARLDASQPDAPAAAPATGQEGRRRGQNEVSGDEVQQRLTLVAQPTHEVPEVASAALVAQDTISVLRSGSLLTAGDELHRALVSVLGYGHSDMRLKAFMRQCQKALER